MNASPPPPSPQPPDAAKQSGVMNVVGECPQKWSQEEHSKLKGHQQNISTMSTAYSHGAKANLWMALE